MAVWKMEFGAVHLDDSDVNEAMKSVGSLLMKSIEFQQVIDTSIRNIKAFFRWLYTIIVRMYSEVGTTPSPELMKMSPQDLQFVANFIEENFNLNREDKKKFQEDARNSCVFNLDGVGQYLKPYPLVTSECSMNNLSLNPWVKYLEERPHFPYESNRHKAEMEKISGSIPIYPHDRKTSLEMEHKMCLEKLERVFDRIHSRIFDDHSAQRLSLFEGAYGSFGQKLLVKSPFESSLPFATSLQSMKSSHVTSGTDDTFYSAMKTCSEPNQVGDESKKIAI